jgi:hypothetical protein
MIFQRMRLRTTARFIVLTSLIFILTVASESRADEGAPLVSQISSDELILAARTTSKKKKYRPQRRYTPRTTYPEIRTDIISLGASYFRYKFDSTDLDAVEKAESWLYYSKIQFKVSYLLLGFMGEGTRVDGDYEGKLTSGEDVSGTLENKLLRVEYTMGFSYAVSERFHFVAPYTGLGYRYWRREGEISGAEANDRYEWFYVPVGFRLQFQPFRNFILGIDGSVRPIIAGRAKLYRYKNTVAGNPDVPEGAYPIFKLKRGLCYRGELPLEFYLGRVIGIAVTPWYDYASLGQDESKTVNVADVVSISRMEAISYGIRLALNIYL